MAKFHPVDVHVGDRMRQRRCLLGMSQTKFGDGVGLTFQQIQKYERGSNRVSASRLFEFAKVLNVPVAFFFDQMSSATKASRTKTKALPVARETIQLVRAYYKIRDPGIRRCTLTLIKKLEAIGASKARRKL
jgi:transcriptional regulator with XRE-family HTH domain